MVYPGKAEVESASNADESQVLVIGDPLNEGRFQRAKTSGSGA